MTDLMTSARRIRACYRGELAGRIPIGSPISWGPMQDIDAEKPGGWRAEAGFVRLARMVQQHCDPVPPFCPVRRPRVFSDIAYQRFLEAPDECIEALPAEKVGATRTRHTTVLHTPRGDLFWSYDEDEGIETRWDVRKPVKCPADVEKMLSVPWRFRPPEPAEFEPFRQHRRQAGPDCIAGAGVNSMVAMLTGMMSYELMLEWVLAEPGLIKMLADAWLQRTGAIVDFLLDQGVGPFWHFNGVERACPPMMGPRQWDELVVAYDGQIMRRIKARDPEAIIHVHCHGKVGRLLDVFLAMGVDSTDPVEPPPQGDVEFAEARRRVGDRMVLCGNLEFLDLETRTPDEIEGLVGRAIQEAGPRRVFLRPSAAPHQRHSDRFLANAQRYIEAGLKYGAP